MADAIDEFETITLHHDGPIARLRLNRPDGANAVSPRFARELLDAVLWMQGRPELKVVTVTAEGPMFSAGGDLKEFYAAGEDLPHVAAKMLVDFHAALIRMNQLPVPVIAGVGGAAGGAGLSMVTAFDLVIASDQARFTMAYTKAGVTPDGTASYFLGRHIGVRRAMDLVLTNRVLSAPEAEAWGLVNRVVPAALLDDAVEELAAQLAAGSRFAQGQAKQLVYRGADDTIEAAAEREAQTIVAAMAQPDGREGIAAFVERRTVRFED